MMRIVLSLRIGASVKIFAMFSVVARGVELGNVAT